jgi:zinc/manganese transport system substrate-binding protein
MKTLSVLFASFALAAPLEAGAQLRVVATVPDLAAIAREIGGEAVRVESLSTATQDPHFVDPNPAFAVSLNRADLLLLVGMELEVGWLPTLVQGARNPRIQPGAPGYCDASRFVEPLEVPTERVDRSMGDVHSAGNPHYLADPRAGEAVARGVAGRLAALDPKNAEEYRRRADRLVARLRDVRERAETELGALRGAPVLSYHRSWAYLTDWLGLAQVGFLEPKPGIPPNPSHVAQLIAGAARTRPRLLLQEAHYPDGTSRIVAGRIGARLVKLPGGTDFRSGQGYPEHIADLVRLLREALTAGREN